MNKTLIEKSKAYYSNTKCRECGSNVRVRNDVYDPNETYTCYKCLMEETHRRRSQQSRINAMAWKLRKQANSVG